MRRSRLCIAQLVIGRARRVRSMARDMGVIGGLPLSAADVDGGFPPVPARQCLLTKKIGVFLASFYTQKEIKSNEFMVKLENYINSKFNKLVIKK